LQKDSSAIQEVKVVEIEERLNAELTKRREIERKLIVLNEQVRNQKHLDHLRRLSNFI
jgi:glucose-6-phosphate-specific signal transduction histidine kinase